MSVAAAAQRPLASRRTGVVFIAIALGLALIGGFAANSYVSGEAAKVSAPLRDVWVAARDVPAGTLVGPGDVQVARLPIPDELRSAYLGPAEQVAGREATLSVPQGVTIKMLRKGQPLTAGDLLAAESATSVAPLIPPVVRVGDKDEPVAGGLNVPLSQLVAPPPKFRVGDKVDIWAATVGPQGTSGGTQVVLGEITVIAFTGTADSPAGIVLAVTPEQLDRYLFFASTGSPMILTVRSAQAK